MWQAFLDSLPLTRDVVIEQGATGWEKIMCPFAAVRSWGVAIGPAYAVQGVVTLAAIAATLWLAWQGRPALRNAAVTAAVLIATPYVLDYDYVVLLLGIAFLWKDGERARLADAGTRRCWRSSGSRRSFARSVAEVDADPARPADGDARAARIAVRRALRASPSRH